MKKILIHVFVRNAQDIRTDIKNWDRYGASQALDEDLARFPKTMFQTLKGDDIAENTEGGYFWRLTVATDSDKQKYQIRSFPTILFIRGNQIVARIEGTPHERGAVAAVLQKIVRSNKKMYAGLSLFALLMFGGKILKNG